MQLCNPSSFFCVFYSYPIVMPSWTLEHMNVFANRSCKSKLERVSVDVFTADDTRHEHSVDKRSVQLCKTSSFYDCSFATMPSRTPSLHKTQYILTGTNQYLLFVPVEWRMIDNNWCFHHEQRPTRAPCNLQVFLCTFYCYPITAMMRSGTLSTHEKQQILHFRSRNQLISGIYAW